MSASLPFGLPYLNALNIRLIGVDRPGLGNSTFHAEKSLETWVDDIRFFLKARAINSPHVLGFSQGSVFALALAAAGLCPSAAVVSGQDDFSNPEVFGLLPVEVASFIQRFQMKDKEFIEGFAKNATAEALWNLIKIMSSEKDRVYYESEPFQSAYQQCLKEGFIQGPQGYVQDLEMTFGYWSFVLENIKTRVDLWYGSLDASAVHSPDYGVTLARRLPHSRHFLLPQEGGSILWTQAERILGELIN